MLTKETDVLPVQQIRCKPTTDCRAGSKENNRPYVSLPLSWFSHRFEQAILYIAENS